MQGQDTATPQKFRIRVHTSHLAASVLCRQTTPQKWENTRVQHCELLELQHRGGAAGGCPPYTAHSLHSHRPASIPHTYTQLYLHRVPSFFFVLPCVVLRKPHLDHLGGSWLLAKNQPLNSFPFPYFNEVGLNTAESSYYIWHRVLTEIKGFIFATSVWMPVHC